MKLLPAYISTNVDAAKRKFSVLAPSPGRLPSKVAIAGSIEWVEDE
jgi:polyribonucleotide 5'-hydroxyl-kinase